MRVELFARIERELGVRLGEAAFAAETPADLLKLLGAGLGSMVIGFPLALMSTLAFLARPVRWLEVISRQRGTLLAAPNFAYEIFAN